MSIFHQAVMYLIDSQIRGGPPGRLSLVSQDTLSIACDVNRPVAGSLRPWSNMTSVLAIGRRLAHETLLT